MIGEGRNGREGKSREKGTIRYVVRAVFAGLFVALSSVPQSAHALSVREQNISRYATFSVKGDCAPYFQGRFQVRPLPSTRSCTVTAQLNLHDLITKGGFKENSSLSVQFAVRQGTRGNGARSIRLRRGEFIQTVLSRKALNIQLQQTVRIAGGRTNPLARLSLRGAPSFAWVDPIIDPTPVGDSCAQVAGEFADEQAAIRSCVRDSDCGLALQGIGCGCSRAPIARLDADPTRLYDVLDRAVELQCDLLPISTACDCPLTEGIGCVQGRCEWKYLEVAID